MQDTLNAYFQELERQERFSGVALITRGAEVLFAGAYGYANRAWRVPNTLETRFDTASVTKLFTAAATLQLVDQGAFTLDTRALDYLGLTGTAISPEVTVWHILTHTSGIGDDCEEEAGEVYEDLWRTKANYLVTETVDFLPQFAHKAPNFAPGQGCRYCNCSFILLGLMIEKATGMTYRDYVRRHIFAPAGMARSDFFRLDQVNADVAEGCDPITDAAGNVVGWKRNIYAFPPVGSPDSGAHVTAADLTCFLRAAQSRQLFSPALTEQFLRPHVFYREGEHWRVKTGFVLEFYHDKADQLVFYQKEGVNAGVSDIIRYYPALDVTVVLLSNLMDGVWDPVWHIHEEVMIT